MHVNCDCQHNGFEKKNKNATKTKHERLNASRYSSSPLQENTRHDKQKLKRTIKSGNCDNGNNTENGDGEKEKQTRLKGM